MRTKWFGHMKIISNTHRDMQCRRWGCEAWALLESVQEVFRALWKVSVLSIVSLDPKILLCFDGNLSEEFLFFI